MPLFDASLTIVEAGVSAAAVDAPLAKHTGGRNKRGRSGAVEVQQGVQDALNRRRGGDDTASNGGDDSS